MYVDGSENWTDYEVEADITWDKAGMYTEGAAGANTAYGYLLFKADATGGSTETGWQQCHSNSLPVGYQYVSSSLSMLTGSERTTYTGLWHSLYTNQTTHIKATVMGDTLTATGDFLDTTGKTQNTLTVSTAGKTGGFALASLYGGAVSYDNLVIRDLSATAKISGKTEDLVAGDVLTLTFTENMNFDSFAGNVVFSDGFSEIPASFTDNGANELYVTVPDLATGAEYILKVKKEATDAQGTAMCIDREFAITTKKADFNCISTVPASGAVDVNTLEDVILRFDKNVDFNSIEDIVIELKDEAGSTIPCKVDTALSSNNSLYISINNKLENGTKYTMNVSGVKSSDGDSMIGSITLSFETEEKAEEYLYYNDFTDGLMTGLSITKDTTTTDYTNGAHENNYYIENGKLYMQLNSTQVAQDIIAATIDGSENWSDYEVSIDMSITSDGVKYPTVWTRGGADNGYRAMFSVFNETSNHTFAPFDTSGFIDNEPKWLSGERTFTITAVGDKMSYKFGDTVVYDNETIPEDNLKLSGAIAFGTMYQGTVAFDNIKVKDIGISYTVGKYKNYTDDDVIEVTFDRTMDEMSFDTANVSVTDKEGTELNVTAYPINSTTMGIKLPSGLKSKEIYTVTLKKDILTATGIGLSSDKTFDIKASVKEVDVSDLSLKNASGTVDKLVDGELVKGYADITNNSAAEQDFTIIMAIYDDDVLIDIKEAHKRLPAKTSGTVETAEYAVGSSAGLTIRVMAVDTLDTIKPLSECKYYTK